MGVEFITCPVCKQKLGVQSYTLVGTMFVCANGKCEANMRVTHMQPLRVEHIPVEATYNANSRPESYG